MTSWDSALHDFEASLDLVEEALETGSWDAVEDLDWGPSAEPGIATFDDRGRLEGLLKRASALREQLIAAQSEIVTALSRDSRRRTAARSYLSSGPAAG